MLINTHDNIKLYAQQSGSGTPIVMLHGLMVGHIGTWYFGVSPFLANTYRVILYDLRGHGQSERATTGYSLDSMVKDLASVIEQTAAGPVHLVAHSYGGCVATLFALRHPELVRSLTLVEVTLPPFNAKGVKRLFQAGKIRDFFNLFLLPKNLRRDIIKGNLRGKRILDNLNFLKQRTSLVDDMCAEPGIDETMLAKIEVPVLAIYASRSLFKKEGLAIANAIQNSKFLKISGGHNLPYDNPDDLTEAITLFLNQQPQASEDTKRIETSVQPVT